jgi:hypothetical protein
MNKQKIVVTLFLVTVLGLLLSRPATQVKANSESEGVCASFDPTATSLLPHLEQAHGVRIGAASDCDVVLSKEGEWVVVEFQEPFISRLRPDALLALELDGPRTLMSETKYNAFLFMFHAYLTMAPPAERE